MATATSLLLAVVLSICSAIAEAKVKVFVMAGQSNMHGRGKVYHLQRLHEQGEYTYFKNADDTLKTRDDVRITTEQRRGDVSDLAFGYGIPVRVALGIDGKFGPEMGFGWTVGDYYDEPVLIIKIGISGTSLATDWRPPSAAAATEDYRKVDGTPFEGGDYGRYFRVAMAMASEATQNLDEYIDDYDGSGFEYAGFVWFQGWNDANDPRMLREYPSLLTTFIFDVKRFLGDQEIPFLIGELGMEGPVPVSDHHIEMRRIQATVARTTRTVELVETGKFVTRNCNENFVNTECFDDIEHYWGRADTYIQIGNAMAEMAITADENRIRPITSSPSASPTRQSPDPTPPPTVPPTPPPTRLPTQPPTAPPTRFPTPEPTRFSPGPTPPRRQRVPCPELPAGACSVCGEGECVNFPDNIYPSPGEGFPAVTCQNLALSGEVGLIEDFVCPLLPDLISVICGCDTSILQEVETTEPCPEVPEGGCSVCGPGKCVTDMDAMWQPPAGIAPAVSCINLEMSGRLGLIDEESCPFMPTLISSVCGCGDAVPIGTDYFPSQVPSEAPSEAPSVPTFPPGLEICFTGDMTVDVLDRDAPVFMKDLQLGDKVLVDEFDNYEVVYSFGHIQPDAVDEFVQVRLAEQKNALKLSSKHMLDVQGKGFVPASLLEVGDLLQTSSAGVVAIAALDIVVGEGQFAPFTSSGTIMVNGIKASTYVAFQASATITLGESLTTPLTYQWMAHTFQFPHRFLCTHVMSCAKESYSDGISNWVHAPMRLSTWWLEQPASVASIILGIVLLPLTLWAILEWFLVNPVATAALAVACWSLVLRRTQFKVKNL